MLIKLEMCEKPGPGKQVSRYIKNTCTHRIQNYGRDRIWDGVARPVRTQLREDYRIVDDNDDVGELISRALTDENLRRYLSGDPLIMGKDHKLIRVQLGKPTEIIKELPPRRKPSVRVKRVRG